MIIFSKNCKKKIYIILVNYIYKLIQVANKHHVFLFDHHNLIKKL